MSADQLKALLDRLDISPRELAARIGLTPKGGRATVPRWRSGERAIPPLRAVRIRQLRQARLGPRIADATPATPFAAARRFGISLA